jgi:hypothetical protein
MLELALRQKDSERRIYVVVFWVFMASAVTCMVLSVGFGFSFGSGGWLSLTAALICEARQQAAKGWIAGVSLFAAAIRSEGAILASEHEVDPFQVVQPNGATEEMNWRAHA